MKNDPQQLARLSILITLSLILGKFLTIDTGIFRINLGNLPVIIAGLAYGSGAGFAVGAIVDGIGCVLKGYSWNPLITLGIGVFGFCAGLPHKNWILKVFLGHFLGSVIINTLALRLWYGYNWSLLLIRIPNTFILAIVEVLVLRLLMQNREFQKIIHLDS